MAIDRVGWPQRPNPAQHDGRRQQQPKRKLPRDDSSEQKRPAPEQDRRPGGIDEVV